MKKESLVSIVITTYGRTDFLKKALESACNQTYRDIEIILVDDNADKSEIRKQVVELAKEYHVQKLILNETNLGGSLSRNEGIKAAQGGFVSFLDDDDTYHPKRIEKYIAAYEKEGDEQIGIIYSFVDEVASDGKKLREYRITLQENPLYQHMCSCLAATSQWMVPRYVFDRVGMFEDSPCKQDSIMLLKILGAGYHPLCVEEVLVYYTNHNQGRISGIGEKNRRGLLNFRDWCRKYYDKITKKEQRQVEANFASQLLTLYLLNDNRKEAGKQLKLIIKNTFFSKRTVKALLKYCIGKKYFEMVKNRQE